MPSTPHNDLPRRETTYPIDHYPIIVWERAEARNVLEAQHRLDVERALAVYRQSSDLRIDNPTRLALFRQINQLLRCSDENGDHFSLRRLPNVEMPMPTFTLAHETATRLNDAISTGVLSATTENSEVGTCEVCNQPIRSGDTSVNGYNPDRGTTFLLHDENCRDDYEECERCNHYFERRFLVTDADGEVLPLCRPCADREEASIRHRSGDMDTQQYRGGGTGTIITSHRPFGCELELCAKSRQHAQAITKNLPAAFGIGTDGSIRGEFGLEIRTPVLARQKGERALRDACRVLLKNGSVNRSCGLHIHLETLDIKNNWAAVKKVWLFYFIFDEVIMAMLPSYRRRSRYAKSLRHGYSLEAIRSADGPEALTRLWYNDSREAVSRRRREAKDSTRYYGTNLHTLMDSVHQTLEIRFHSPTLQPAKILSWVALHQAILDRVHRYNEKLIDRAGDLLFFEDKLNAFLEILNLPTSLQRYVLGRIQLFNPQKKALADLPERLTSLSKKTQCAA